jgi:hypothetical protein
MRRCRGRIYVRFQFPLYKLFLVTAAYAMAFAAFGSAPVVGVLVATWVGTAVAVWILAVKTRMDLLRSAVAALGSAFGIFYAWELNALPLLGAGGASLAERLFKAILPSALAAIFGAILFAATGRIIRKWRDEL